MSTTATKNKDTYFEAVGRRKTSIARVRLFPNQKGLFMINDRALNAYFPSEELQRIANSAFNEAQVPGKFSVTAKIVGGGIHSQAEALAHGIARALLVSDAALKGVLRKASLLTRDPRAKERRKFGLKKARKSPQWSKR